MAMRGKLVAAATCRYRAAPQEETKQILDEFVAVTGFHRKHAIRLLRSGRSGGTGRYRPERRL